MLNAIHLFQLIFGHTVRMWVRGWPRGLLLSLLPVINEPKSGRAECAGMGSRGKQQKKKPFEGSLPIDQIDWHGNQRRVLSLRLMFEAVKS